MKTQLAVYLLALSFSAQADTLYKCQTAEGKTVYDNARKGRECLVISQDVKPYPFKVGDVTSQGLVIEVKPPIVKLQTEQGERWLRMDSLPPPR